MLNHFMNVFIFNRSPISIRVKFLMLILYKSIFRVSFFLSFSVSPWLSSRDPPASTSKCCDWRHLPLIPKHLKMITYNFCFKKYSGAGELAQRLRALVSSRDLEFNSQQTHGSSQPIHNGIQHSLLVCMKKTIAYT